MTTRTRTCPGSRPARRRSGTRTRTRLTFIDRFMLAGIVGGLVHLALLHLARTPVVLATVAGLVTFGFALAVLVSGRRVHLRAPIVWRSRR